MSFQKYFGIYLLLFVHAWTMNVFIIAVYLIAFKVISDDYKLQADSSGHVVLGAICGILLTGIAVQIPPGA